MPSIWTNKTFWLRLGLLAALVWVGGTVIASAVLRDFVWTGWRGSIGPATTTAVVGAGLAFIAGLAVPWICASLRREP